MENIKTVADVQNESTSALVKFYNHHNAEKQIKKFADRPTAIKRCEALARELGLPETEPVIAPVAQPEFKATWPTIGAPLNQEETKKEQESEGSDEEADESGDAAPISGAFAGLLSGPSQAQLAAINAAAGATQVKDGKKVDPNAKVEEERDASGRASNSAGIAASWLKPDVFAARLTRDQVTVTVDGATTEHNSTRMAFRHYRLPSSKHIRFRMKLKQDRQATFEWNGVAYLFNIVSVAAE